jgi:hypothetical protein
LNPLTEKQYKRVIEKCREIFRKKNHDYGTAWRILRPSSITDQIFIKANRIRSIQEKGTQMVADDVQSEFVGIINYCIMALIQLDLASDTNVQMDLQMIMKLYDAKVEETFSLLERKNHDYDEAWRSMRVSSITDIILMKLFRTKQIEDLQGKTLISEGLEANYQDMINYAVFASILNGFADSE